MGFVVSFPHREYDTLSDHGDRVGTGVRIRITRFRVPGAIMRFGNLLVFFDWFHRSPVTGTAVA